MADKWWDSSLRTRPCLDSVSVSTPINLFQDTDTPRTTASLTTSVNTTFSTTADTTSLHMMGLRLSSPSPPQSLDWNQSLFRGDQNSENTFQNMIQDQDHSLSSNTTNFQLESNLCRSDNMYASSSQDSSSDFKQINVHKFQLDQPMQDSDNESITCQGLNSSFQNIDLYGSPSRILQSLHGSNSNQQQDSGFDQNQGMSYSLYQSRYDVINRHGGVGGVVSEEFAVNSSTKAQLAEMGANQLHFSNNTRFWNVSEAGVSNIRASFFPSLQIQLPLSTIEDKPKITSRVTKESIIETSSTKRPRNDNQSLLPSFKVKKEKMGDRITTLQQLVSPFGKTDTASVLSEAIEYIKFLHEQVSVLSTPYMKNGCSTMQHQPLKLQQTSEKSSDEPSYDLRRRGLCLVPVSSTFPVTHETTVDFWTPTFGGTF